MAEVKQIDYTNKDYESFRSMMIDEIPTKIPEWTDTSQSDMGIVIIELLAHGLDILSFYQDRKANEAYLPTARLRKSIIDLASLVGYDLTPATPSKVLVNFNFSAPTSNMVIPKGFQVGTRRTATEGSIVFEAEETVEVPNGSLSVTVPCVQGYSVYNETLGSGNNEPEQKFILKNKPVIIDDTISVWVREGTVWNLWTKVDDFIYSEKEDRHYTVFVDENDNVTLTFGNGINGAKVPTGSNNVKSDYRVGGGSVGNVGSNTITQVLSGGVLGVSSITNPSTAYILGTDKEDIKSAKDNVRRQSRLRDCIVWAQDFEDYILKNYRTTVDKVQSVVDEDGNFTVFIKPIGEDLPTTELKDIVLKDVDEKRILTCGVTMSDPSYLEVNMVADVYVLDNYKQSDVLLEVLGSLDTYKDSLGFKQDVTFGDVFRAVISVQGVKNTILKKEDGTVFEDVVVPSGHIAKVSYTVNPIGGVV